MLTRRQLQLYNFLKVYFKKNKIMPSFDEILLFMKMKSKAQAFQMLGYLEYKGYIKRNPHRARSIEITKEI
jgi:repressor LexA